MVSPIASFVAGGVVGHVLTKGQEQALTLEQLLEMISRSKPTSMFVRPFDASSARSDQEIKVQGDFLLVSQDAASVGFRVKLNEAEAPSINLDRIQAVQAPFYRLFLSNVAGNGSLTLIGGKGVTFFPRFKGIEELAARTGSIVTFDRRGDVFWIEDFENSLNKWTTSLGGAGAGAAISTARARNGASSVILTSGSTIDWGATITHREPIPTFSKIGIEMSVAMEDFFDLLTLDVLLYNGTNRLRYGWRYDDDANDLLVANAAGGYDTVVNIDLTHHTALFHTFKLVIDPGEVRNVRLILDNVEYDVSGVGIFTAADTTPPSIESAISIVGQNGENDIIYVDDVIFTKNEP